MTHPKDEKKKYSQNDKNRLEKDLKETFPASDAPAVTQPADKDGAGASGGSPSPSQRELRY